MGKLISNNSKVRNFFYGVLTSTIFFSNAYALTPAQCPEGTTAVAEEGFARMILSERCNGYFTSKKGKLVQVESLTRSLRCGLKFRLRNSSGEILANTPTSIFVNASMAKSGKLSIAEFGPVLTDSRGLGRLSIRLDKNRIRQVISAVPEAGVKCVPNELANN
jgi:hypothetical protein